MPGDILPLKEYGGQYPRRASKNKKGKTRRGWGMRGFAFTADHRWRFDHLTNAADYSLPPSPRRLSLPISPRCRTAVTPRVSSAEQREVSLTSCMLLFPFVYSQQRVVISGPRHSGVMNMEFMLLRGKPEKFNPISCFVDLTCCSRQTRLFFFCLPPLKVTFSKNPFALSLKCK